MAFKICLIGCGGMAQNGHGPMLHRYAAMRPDVELAACCDVNAERANAFAAEFGFRRAFTDLHEMLDAEKPDGAVLAVPYGLTARLAVEILRRGIPLLTEKPPGTCMEEGNAIVDAARRAGVPVSVAFNRRTMPIVQALVAEMDTVGGEVTSVEIDMCRVNRTEPDFSTTAIHDVDLAMYLARSQYRSARFLYHVHEQEAPATDILVLGEMQSGAAVRLGFYPMCGILTERVTVRKHGHTFTAHLPVYSSPDIPGSIVHLADNGEVRKIHGEPCDAAEANGFLGEYTSFFDALREGRVPPHAVADCLQTVELEECIRLRAAEYVRG